MKKMIQDRFDLSIPEFKLKYLVLVPLIGRFNDFGQEIIGKCALWTVLMSSQPKSTENHEIVRENQE